MAAALVKPRGNTPEDKVNLTNWGQMAPSSNGSEASNPQVLGMQDTQGPLPGTPASLLRAADAEQPNTQATPPLTELWQVGCGASGHGTSRNPKPPANLFI